MVCGPVDERFLLVEYNPSTGVGGHVLWSGPEKWSTHLSYFPSLEIAIASALLKNLADFEHEAVLWVESQGFDMARGAAAYEALGRAGVKQTLYRELHRRVGNSPVEIRLLDASVARSRDLAKDVLSSAMDEAARLNIGHYRSEADSSISEDARAWAVANEAVIVYTDGSAGIAEGQSGWAWFVSGAMHDSGSLGGVTSTVAEMWAALEALTNEALQGEYMVLATDCETVYNCFRGKFPNGVPDELNAALAAAIDSWGERVYPLKVKAHSNLPGNMEADRLADAARLEALRRVRPIKPSKRNTRKRRRTRKIQRQLAYRD